MSKAVRSSVHQCSLCFLPIPQGIVDSSHPLFGTVDHVIPLSKGGTNAIRNRAPAHRFCNMRKGASLSVAVGTVMAEIHPALTPLLLKMGELTPKQLKSARGKCHKERDKLKQAAAAARKSRQCIFIATPISRWEGEGGACA